MNHLLRAFSYQKVWVNWKYQKVIDPKTGQQEVGKDGLPKFTKIPIGSSTDPETWSFYRDLPNHENIGIMFGLDDCFMGIDIDHCLKWDEDKRKYEVVHEKREEILALIKKADTYFEVSPSKTGIHVYFKIAEPGYKVQFNKKEPFEVYTSKRYFTVTQNVIGKDPDGKPVRELKNEAEVLEVLSIIGYPWGKEKKEVVQKVEANNATTGEVTLRLEDAEILEKMFKAKNGEKMQSLYNGDTGEFGGDESSADMSFCMSLAFWTRKNREQMERIWKASPLGNRGKTQERADYRDRTIDRAVTECKEVYETTEERKKTHKKVYEPKKKEKEQQQTVQGKQMEYTSDAFVGTETNETASVTASVSQPEISDKDEIDYEFLGKWQGTSKNPVWVDTLCTENICRVLRLHPSFKGKFRFDEFQNVFEIQQKVYNEHDGSFKTLWRGYDDPKDTLAIQTKVSILFPQFQTVKAMMIYDAMQQVAMENVVDSASAFIKGIKWDGVERLAHWLRHTYGVSDTEYHRKVASNWMKGLVKRIIYPGCKFDYVLVLEGEQGTKKSSSLALLGGKWHLETTMSTDTKDFFMQFQGKAIIEFSEGETLSRTEIKRMKAIITTQTDNFRPPFGRASKDHPRRCVFAMTTNNSEYLKDETGNRRWLPVRMVFPEANLEWLEENREQLFAEAYHRVVIEKETVWDFPKEDTIREQEERRVTDPNEELITGWYFNTLTEEQRNQGITVHQVYVSVFAGGFGLSKPISKYEEMNIANVLKNVMKLNKKQTMKNGVRASRWYPEGIDEDMPIANDNLESNVIKKVEVETKQQDFGVF